MKKLGKWVLAAAAWSTVMSSNTYAQGTPCNTTAENAACSVGSLAVSGRSSFNGFQDTGLQSSSNNLNVRNLTVVDGSAFNGKTTFGVNSTLQLDGVTTVGEWGALNVNGSFYANQGSFRSLDSTYIDVSTIDSSRINTTSLYASGSSNLNTIYNNGRLYTTSFQFATFRPNGSYSGTSPIVTGIQAGGDETSASEVSLATKGFVQEEDAHTLERANINALAYARTARDQAITTSNAYTDQTAVETLSKANSYTDSQISIANQKAKSYAAGAGAGTLAVVSAPVDGGLGAALYTVGGQTAIALGIRTPIAQRYSVSATVSKTRYDTTGGVGVGWKW